MGSSLGRIDQDRDVAWIDPAINYYKIQYAQLCIHQNNKGCLFIATNLDMVFPTEGDQDWAAGGAIIIIILILIIIIILGEKVLFVTNNSMKSRRRELNKFHAMGMMDVLLEGKLMIYLL